MQRLEIKGKCKCCKVEMKKNAIGFVKEGGGVYVNMPAMVCEDCENKMRSLVSSITVEVNKHGS